MQISTDRLHYWFQAIRQSPDPMRTMDAFWAGQLKSKEWLIRELRKNVKQFVSIDIHGALVVVQVAPAGLILTYPNEGIEAR